MKRIYMTTYNNIQITAVFNQQQLIDIYVDGNPETDIMDRIYIGKVKNVVKNINAAFIDIGIGVDAYYSLTKNPQPIFLNQKKNDQLVAGDEVLVQVSGEAVKTKVPTLSSRLNFAGKYMVLIANKPTSSISSKIKKETERTRLKAMFAQWETSDYGFVVRTKAENVSEDILFEEMCQLKDKYQLVVDKSRHLPCFANVYKEPPAYIRRLLDMDSDTIEKIVTDIPEVYQSLTDHQASASWAVSMYDDQSVSLSNLIGLPTQIERLLQPKVWLKSGAYLVINPTEAMVVIDVNTGKFTGKKNQEETFFKINTEAAVEIIRQLRLRNLSGIIIVDFIDMKDEQHKKQLMNMLRIEAGKEKIRTVVVDMTKLNLVEMTRQKTTGPLFEQFKKQGTK